MSAARITARGAVMAGTQILFWVWLIVLSVWVGIGSRTMTGLADREHVETGLRQVQVLEARIAELADSVQLLQAQPESATIAVLHETRKRLETRLTRIEQTLADRSTAVELQALRTEVEQMKIRSEPVPIEPPPPTKPATPAAAKQSPFPFRVLGSEIRAGQRSLTVAPVKGELTADKIQVVLPGEAVGQWRLQAIEGSTAVFQNENGKQTRRLVIP
ncbi:hypothetical protein ACMHYO_07270 [Allopusillimonas ginsengisoli]|uniref:hypothetical protein n=1 Tax=Allopusillimonas ginsengisoli TaxID=453575 RepID=UPI0039C04FDE